jgi:hypothetical protein
MSIQDKIQRAINLLKQVQQEIGTPQVEPPPKGDVYAYIPPEAQHIHALRPGMPIGTFWDGRGNTIATHDPDKHGKRVEV